MSAENHTPGMPFSEFLDRVTDPAFELDREWCVTYVNDQVLRRVDYTEDELLGNVFWELFPDVRGTRYESKYREVMEAREPTSFEEYYSASEAWTNVRVHPSENGIIVHYRDITGRKEIETILAQHDTLLEAIGNGLFLIDDGMEFVEVNRTFSELVGYPQEELVGSHLTKLVPEADLAAGIEIAETVIDGDREVGVLETELEAANGTTIPVLSRFVPFTSVDGSVRTIGVVRDLSERKVYERTLTSLRDASRKLIDVESPEAVCDLLVEAATDVFDFTGVVVYLHDDADETLVPIAHSEDVEDRYKPSQRIPTTPDNGILASVYLSGETARFDDIADSELRLTKYSGIRSGLFVPLGSHGLVAVGDCEVGLFDERTVEMMNTLAVTAESALNRLDRESRIRTREETVTTLHDATRDLMEAETKQEISEVAVTASIEFLGLSSVGVYLWNERRGVLESSALSPEIRNRFDKPPVFEADNSLAWDVFVGGETKLYTDLRDEDRRYNSETPLRSELMIPIGTHGVFLCGSTCVDAYDETDVESAELLVTNVAAALDRADREQDVREQERRLQTQNQELTRLNQINTVVRSVVKSLVQTTSSDQLTSRVCEHLGDAEPYRFAWFAARDQLTGAIEPQAWSEENASYFDSILPASAGAEFRLPVERALASEEPQVVERILAYEGSESWRKAALKRGYQSAISVPIGYGSVVYGVLEVYGTRPSMFTGEEYDVLVELSDTLGNAINAMERTEALLAGSDTELEFRTSETEDPLFSLSRASGHRIEVEALVPTANDSWLLYVLVKGGDPKRVTKSIEGHLAVRSVRHIRSKGDWELFGVVVSEVTTLVALAEHGATTKSISVEDGVERIVLTIPRTIDVRAFVETCRELIPDAELVRRSHVEPSTESTNVDATAQLTDRQRESIELAYQCGYFAWPRDQTGGEIAEMMGITPPTFHSHLRKGLNSVLEAIIDGSSAADLTD